MVDPAGHLYLRWSITVTRQRFRGCEKTPDPFSSPRAGEQIRQRPARNRQARPDRQGEGDGRRHEAPAHITDHAPRRRTRRVVIALRRRASGIKSGRSTRPGCRTQARHGARAKARRRDRAGAGARQAEEVRFF